jgi:hypothetical protein
VDLVLVPCLVSNGQDQVHAPRSRGWIVDGIALLAVVGLFFAIHDVQPALKLPYWLDEAWVALSTKLPLSDLPTDTASTPLGWSFLLRLIPFDNGLRLLPLGFLCASALLAYWFGRALPWPRPKVDGVLVGLVAAVMVLLLPAQQVRHDLKQYTADAALALLVLVLATRVEAAWTRRRLAVLAGVSVVGMLVSHTTAIVAAVSFAALFLVALVRRDRRRLIETAIAGAVAAVGLGLVYVFAAKAGRTSSLDEYWSLFFPRISELPTYISARLTELQVYLGLPWPFFVLLMALGVAVIAAVGRPATAIATGGLPLAMIVLGVGKVYPLLDLRTSHFLLVVAVAVGGIGIAGFGLFVARHVPRPALAGAVAVTMALVFVGLYAVANLDWIRFSGRNGPEGISVAYVHEDVRKAVSYVRSHRKPEDVILVGPLAAFGFAYYWHTDDPQMVTRPAMAVRWGPDYAADSGIVVVPDRTPQAIAAGLARAEQLARKRGPNARIWLIRSHVITEEKDAWSAALQGFRTEKTPSGTEPATIVYPR